MAGASSRPPATAARKGIHVYPEFPTAHRLLAASLSAAGRIERAQEAVTALRRIAPNMSVARTRAGVPWKNPEDMEHYLDALRRAGLPE